MKKWILIAVGVVAVVAAGLWAYSRLSTVTVEVAEPERREAVRAVYAGGAVRAEQIARLRSEHGGQVLKLGVIEGGEIREGELVMELQVDEAERSIPEFDARLEEAKLRVAEARAALEREQVELAAGRSSQESVDSRRAILNQASAYQKSVASALGAERERTPDGRLLSPISGIVTEVNVNVGEMIPPNMEVATILDPSSFKVYAEINEGDINLVQPGQEAVVEFDAMPGERFRARVERVIPQAHEVTKTLPVVLFLVDFVPNLSDGLTATVNIVQQRRLDALTIPASALIYESFDAPTATIFVVDDQSKLEEREVTVGVRGDDYVEILEGLRGNERVAVDPRREWQSGMAVTPSLATPRIVREPEEG